MNAIKEAINRLLRGPAASRLLARMGIEPRKFWLLMDLFGELSERGEVSDQLGSNKLALRTAAWMYFAMSSLMGLGMLLAKPSVVQYSSLFLVLTAVLLLTILLSEAGNSLVNPAEALVMAHQPINGATYTAAKLTHLLRIVLYLVPGMNAVPAVAGSLLKDAPWYFPVVHLLAALGVGLVAGLLCCATFGWLIRYIPARRLKAAAQLASIVPFMVMMWMQQTRKLLAHIDIPRWLPGGQAARWTLIALFGAAAAAIVALGIRSLSVDYLIRVSGMMRGGSAAGSKAGRSRMGDLVAWAFGGQGGRAGFAYVWRMMLRDFQFRRQLVPMLPALIMPVALLGKGLSVDPFSGKFTPMHAMPHLFGGLLFFVCTILPYGGDYKGTWVFLLAPNRVFGGFARGVHALLWIDAILIPNAVLFLLLSWFWGVWHAGLFLLYSVAAGSVYLGLELRLIDGVPFGKQMEPTRSSVMLPLMMMGGAAMAMAVGLQYFFVFRSTAAVALAAAVLGAAAYQLTRSSLGAFEASMRYNLGLMQVKSGTLYKEVDA